MRQEILTRFPGLYYRMHHRPLESGDEPDDDHKSHWSAPDSDNAYLDWNIADVQERMEKALAEEVTSNELEREERKVREERGGGLTGR